MRPPVTYVQLNNGRYVFIPLRYVYPECMQLIEKHERVSPLLCLKSDCPANKNCMSTLVHRVNYLFTEVEPRAELIVAYFKYRDTTSIRAGVFNRDMDDPKVSTINPFSLKRLLGEGTTMQWFPPDEYWRTGPGPDIIPAESLIKIKT